MSNPQQQPLMGVSASQITVVDIYAKVIEMSTQLAVISEQMKSFGNSSADHETRLRGLERFRYTLVGISLVIGVIEGAVGYWIGHIVH